MRKIAVWKLYVFVLDLVLTISILQVSVRYIVTDAMKLSLTDLTSKFKLSSSFECCGIFPILDVTNTGTYGVPSAQFQRVLSGHLHDEICIINKL